MRGSVSDRAKRLAGLLEGLLLLLAGGFGAWLALFGNYEFLMNPKFMWLTFAGGVVVLLMGLVTLIRPRGRPVAWDIAALAAMVLIVAIARPHAHDINSLALPDIPGFEGVPLEIGDISYTQVDLNQISRRDLPEDLDFDGDLVVVTGLIKHTPDMDSTGHFAVVRPFSVCCAADALLVGIRAEGGGNRELADDWVNVYGRVRLLETELPYPKLRHGAIRYASVSKIYVLEPDSIMPYVRPRPAEDVMARLAGDRYTIFLRLAEAAGLAETLAQHEMVTVLVPVDEAFDALPEGTVEELLGDPARLQEFVGNHVLVGLLMEGDLKKLSSAETITGGSIALSMTNGKLRAENSRFLFSNTEAKNGVIHAIYPAIMPATMPATSQP